MLLRLPSLLVVLSSTISFSLLTHLVLSYEYDCDCERVRLRLYKNRDKTMANTAATNTAKTADQRQPTRQPATAVYHAVKAINLDTFQGGFRRPLKDFSRTFQRPQSTYGPAIRPTL